MKLIVATIALVSIVASLPAKNVQQNQSKEDNIQAKRDLSLSYSATDIGSKEGTRVKTITVIKNVIGKKEKPLKIDPKLHKDEDWGSHFRDSFDAYGAIPDVPDIDELFDFVNKKDKHLKEIKPSVEEDNVDNKKESNDKESEEESNTNQTTVLPAPVEEAVSEEKVEKILGDAELIQAENKKDIAKSQSLHLGKYLVKESTNEEYFPVKANEPTNSRKNEKYQSDLVPYYYPQPNPSYPDNVNSYSGNTYQSSQSQKRKGSISISTTSGKKFDVPINNVRTQNSPDGTQAGTSSQRPYIAPSLRKSYEVKLNNSNSSKCATGATNLTTNAQQTDILNLQGIQPNVRTIRFGMYKPNSPRSRGLRY